MMKCFPNKLALQAALQAVDQHRTVNIVVGFMPLDCGSLHFRSNIKLHE